MRFATMSVGETSAPQRGLSRLPRPHLGARFPDSACAGRRILLVGALCHFERSATQGEFLAAKVLIKYTSEF
jgi:hypothetical protein